MIASLDANDLDEAPADEPTTPAEALEQARADRAAAEARVVLCARAFCQAMADLDAPRRATADALERLQVADEELATLERRCARLEAELVGPAMTAGEFARRLTVARQDQETLGMERQVA